MGILFVKAVREFAEDRQMTIGNRRISFEDLKFARRVDLTFQTTESTHKTGYSYLEDPNALKQLLPLPGFLFNPLKKYRLPYETVESDDIRFHGQKTIVYLHGSGSISEDNSILHGILLQNGCDIIRISYRINYEDAGVQYPKKTEDMLPFLAQTEEKIAPAMNEELINILIMIKGRYPDLFKNKEVILLAHSLGGGLAANLAATFTEIQFSKFVNLDGTLMNPAIRSGINVSQLHLSQDRLFKPEWLDEEESGDMAKAIGQDYCKKIGMLLSHSKQEKIWIQIKDSSHFTFTDFPNLLKHYKVFSKLAGDLDAAGRIRKYTLTFILGNEMQIDPKDLLINPGQ